MEIKTSLLFLCKLIIFIVLFLFVCRFGQSCKSWSESTLSAPDESVIKIRIESDNLENPAKALAELPDDLDIPLAERISRISQAEWATG